MLLFLFVSRSHSHSLSPFLCRLRGPNWVISWKDTGEDNAQQQRQQQQHHLLVDNIISFVP